jgi:SAM-dependent methyltransferase
MTPDGGEAHQDDGSRRRKSDGDAEAPPTPNDSVNANVAEWTRTNKEYTDAAAEGAWRQQELTWGVFDVPEEAIGSPLGDVAGLDVVELGCGTAYFSARLAYRGARPVGVDPTPAQLATARRMQGQLGPVFPLVEAPAEHVPLPDASFDLALSEYGASLWADPIRWIPEAARLLRVGGRLVFLTNSTLLYLCLPDTGTATERLQRPQFGMGRIAWPGTLGVEYHLSHGEWIRLLRGHGFEVLDLIEVQAPSDATSHGYYDFVSGDWARRWPAEEIWVAVLTG